MSFITAQYISVPANEFSENLLSVNSTLNNPLIWNILSGTGTVTQEDDINFQGSSLKIESLDNVLLTFSTDTDLGFTAQNDGSYIFSFRIFLESFTGDDPNLTFNIFKNGVLFNQIQAFYTDTQILNNWMCFAQSLQLNNGDEISFTISYQSGTPASNIIWLDGLKCEFDNRSLGIPTAYSLPIDYYSNPYTGWAYYVDSLATPTIVIGTTYTQITIDGLGATIDDYLPKEIRGVSQLWTGSKITPVSVGDDYDGRLDITVTAKTGTPTLIDVILDISGGVAGTNKVLTGYIQTGGTVPYDQSLPMDFFALSTFIANGGKIYARTDTGTITIGRRNIKINRKSKAF